MIRLVPNILTFARFVLTVLFLAMLLYLPIIKTAAVPSYLDMAFVIFLIAGLTDIIDGKIARKYDAASKFGRIVDPFVDKVLVCGAFICFAVIGQPKFFSWPSSQLALLQWTVAAVITLRELIMTVVRHIAESRGINFAATPAGKLKMFVQSVAIGVILVKIAHVPDAAWADIVTLLALAAAIVITVVSAFPAARRAGTARTGP